MVGLFVQVQDVWLGGVIEVDGANTDLVGAPGGKFGGIDAGDAEEGLEESEEKDGHSVRLLHGGDEVFDACLIGGVWCLGEEAGGFFVGFGFVGESSMEI